MNIQKTIRDDMKLAMKEKDVHKKDVLRMILSELKYAQSAVNVHEELDEKMALKVVSSYKKRLAKSLDDYPEGDRKKKILNEIKIIDHYLPKAPSTEDIDQRIAAYLAATEETNFGVLIKGLIKDIGDEVDGRILSERLKAKLAEQKLVK